MITGVAVAVITSPESVRTVAVTRIGPGPVPLLMETQASPLAENAESLIPELLIFAPAGMFGPSVKVTLTGSLTPPPLTTIISPG